MGLFDFLKLKPQQLKPLIDAIRGENLNYVKKHIKLGTDLNSVPGERPPLFYAVQSTLAIMELLVKNGAKVNIQYESGETPLHLAAMHRYLDKVKLLVEYGANVNATDYLGHTPSFYAFFFPSIEETLAMDFAPSKLRELDYLRASQAQPVVDFLKSKGAWITEDDKRTAKAIGNIPEAIRQGFHRQTALQEGDCIYKSALDEITINYSFLHDAYYHLQKKAHLSEVEKNFYDKFQKYEEYLNANSQM